MSFPSSLSVSLNWLTQAVSAFLGQVVDNRHLCVIVTFLGYIYLCMTNKNNKAVKKKAIKNCPLGTDSRLEGENNGEEQT